MRILNPRQRMKMALRLWMPLLVLRIVAVQPLGWSSSYADAIVPDNNCCGIEALVWCDDDETSNITEASPRIALSMHKQRCHHQLLWAAPTSCLTSCPRPTKSCCSHPSSAWLLQRKCAVGVRQNYQSFLEKPLVAVWSPLVQQRSLSEPVNTARLHHHHHHHHRKQSRQTSLLTDNPSQSGGTIMNFSDLPNFTPSSIPPSAFNYERPRHFIQSQPCFQAPSYDSVVKDDQENPNQQNLNSMTAMESPMTDQSVAQSQTQFQYLSLSQNQNHNQNQANGTTTSSPSSSSFCSSISTSSAVPPLSSTASKPTPSTVLRPTMRSSFTLNPVSPSAPSVPLSFSVSSGLGSATLPANQDPVLAPTAYHCSAVPSHSAFSPFVLPNSNLCSQIPPSVPPTSIQASPVSLSCSSVPQSSNQKQIPPAVISLPNSYKGTPHTLPKPTLKKPVTPRPSSSRSTDEDIQGSKDALIQDLEKKLRTKEARRRISQKLSYEERMARRLLGPEGPISMFDQGNLLESQPLQPVFPEGRYTGGLWGRRHTESDDRGDEESAIQEKCYAPRFLQIPADLSMEEGRFCRIDFKVGGLPMPDVTWYLDGKAVRPDEFHKMLVCEKGMHSFIIEIITIHDAGVYECVARNRAGESRFTMRLDVIAQEALQPPTFVQKLLNSRALEGDTVSLECKIDASPTPQVFWKKDKEMLRIDPSRMSLYQDGSGRHRLLIEWVTKSDAGWYTLSAINVAGMSSCNARLDVGTSTVLPIKTAAPVSKLLNLSSRSRAQTASVESSPHHPALLYESEEL